MFSLVHNSLWINIYQTAALHTQYISRLADECEIKIKTMSCPRSGIVYTNSPIPHRAHEKEGHMMFIAMYTQIVPTLKQITISQSIRSDRAHERGSADKPLFWHGDNGVI